MIKTSIISGSHAQTQVLIPRLKLNPSHANIPFVLHKTQLPVRLSYSMTINKALGQTLHKLAYTCHSHASLIDNSTLPFQEQGRRTV